MRHLYAAGTTAALFAALLAGCGPGTGTGTQEQAGSEAQQQQKQEKEKKKQQTKKEQPAAQERQTQDETAQQNDEQNGDGGSSGGYLGTVNKARRSAIQTAALTKLRKEIKRFRALKGRNPRSLEELKEWRGGTLPKAPAGRRYKYDPDSGELKLAPAR
jgi:hypothetical protein